MGTLLSYEHLGDGGNKIHSKSALLPSEFEDSLG